MVLSGRPEGGMGRGVRGNVKRDGIFVYIQLIYFTLQQKLTHIVK